MERKYWQYQVDILTMIEEFCGEIKILKITDTDMLVGTEYFDENMVSPLNKICEQAGFCYVYSPHTLEGRRGRLYPGVLYKFYIKE